MLTGKIHFAQKVGVAPSTTTMVLGQAAGLGIQCFPVPSVQERNAWISRQQSAPAAVAAPARRRLNPYGSEVEMRGLGLVSNTYAWMTGRPYSMPPGAPRGTTALVFSGAQQVGVVDPNDAWNTGATNRLRTHGTVVMRVNPRRGGGFTEQLLGRGLGISSGEAARSLSGLGTIPNDDELARNLCYTPVHSGWIYGNKPTGERYYVDGLYGGEEVSVDSDLIKIQRRQMIFQGITTVAIVGMAAASIWGALHSGASIRKRARARRKRRR